MVGVFVYRHSTETPLSLSLSLSLSLHCLLLYGETSVVDIVVAVAVNQPGGAGTGILDAHDNQPSPLLGPIKCECYICSIFPHHRVFCTSLDVLVYSM